MNVNTPQFTEATTTVTDLEALNFLPQISQTIAGIIETAAKLAIEAAAPLTKVEMFKKILASTQECSRYGIDHQMQKNMLKVINNEYYRNEFLDLPQGVKLLEDLLVRNEPDAAKILCIYLMDIYLIMTSDSVTDHSGKLLVRELNGNLEISPEIYKRPLRRRMLIPMGIATHIERMAVLKANNLMNMSPRSILDIGAGTLIVSKMLRERYGQAKIVAVEPGIITEKAQQVGQNNDIAIHHGKIETLEDPEKFDLITLHFVLEHDIKDSEKILEAAMKKLAEGGTISIAVPNYNAFHRDLELAMGISDRDPVTKLSPIDRLRGHGKIFSIQEMLEMVAKVQAKLGTQLPVHAKTILPRPFSFNEIADIKEHETIYKLEQAGNPAGMEDRGSVIVLTIGNTAQATAQADNQAALEDFKKITDGYRHSKRGRENPERIKKMDEHLKSQGLFE